MRKFQIGDVVILAADHLTSFSVGCEGTVTDVAPKSRRSIVGVEFVNQKMKNGSIFPGSCRQEFTGDCLKLSPIVDTPLWKALQ